MKLFVFSVAILSAIFGQTSLAYLDHNGATLPGLPTPVIKRTMERGFVTYRLDANSAAYPGFRQAASDVAAAGDLGLGIPAFEVDGAPDIWLTMPDDATFIATCGSGAAGCILYWADPIIIYFRRALFYSGPSWRTTIAHEGINYGHAMGEHEQYNDADFICTRKTWTVMDCGSGVWKPQPFDVATVCSVLDPQGVRFTGCGFNPAPPDCEGPVEASGLYWDSCTQRWVNPAGWTFDPAVNIWYTPGGAAEWLGCNQDSLRWNLHVSAWFNVGHGFFDPAGGIWSFAPAC